MGNERIKFRAWWHHQKKMDYPSLRDIGAKYSWPLDWCALMQWTGLKDKNGKEIYEGDVCRISRVHSYDMADPDPETKIVCWDEEESKFGLRWLNWKKATTGYIFCKTNTESLFEVIGNRYENPELLK